LLSAAFVIGGMTNPLYSLLLAHTNDYLDPADMAAASGGMVFINGLGAIAGPLITGWLMGPGVFGPSGFFLLIGVLLFALVAYALYRMTQRASVPVEDTGSYAAVSPILTPVGMEVVQEVTYEADQESSEVENSP